MSKQNDKTAESARERNIQIQENEDEPRPCDGITLTAVFDGDQLVGITASNERNEELTVEIRVITPHGDACCLVNGVMQNC